MKHGFHYVVFISKAVRVLCFMNKTVVNRRQRSLLALLTCILEVSGSNIGHEAGYADCGFLFFSSVISENS